MSSGGAQRRSKAPTCRGRAAPPWAITERFSSWAFLVLGASILALAFGLFRLFERGWKVGPVLLVVLAAGGLCAAFRTDYGSAGGGGPDTWNGFVHALGFTILVFVPILSMLVLAAQFRGDRRWRRLGAYSLAAFLIAVASLAAYLAGGGNMFFFTFLADVLGWLMLVSARALSVAQTAT
jgi:hypothetical protein